MQRILIADDNAKICSILEEYAVAHGYECLTAKDGFQALDIFEKNSIHIVLLDIMMPGLDGIQVCKKIRETSKVPIIMVSAKGEEEDRILGLDIGADDYITKPFGVKEVMARIRALLRRTNNNDDEDIIRCNDLEIDCRNHTTYISGQAIQLTKKEEMLLVLLASSPGRVYTRDIMMEKAWNYDSESSDRAVDNHIKRIRAKIDVYSHPGFEIKTIWGIGYKLEELS